MPLTSIGSYLTTMDDFGSHWDDVNMELGGSPTTDLTLQGGYTRADFLADRATLQAAITDLEDKENDRQIAASQRDTKRGELRDRLSSFRGMMLGKLPGSAYLAAAPKLPALTTSETKFLAPLDDMASLWAKVNADTAIADFTPPLLLGGGYDLATFTTDLSDMRALFLTVNTSENDQRVARKQRDALLPQARARMSQYRVLVAATFGDGHPMVVSLPDMTPPDGPRGGSSTPTGLTLLAHSDFRVTAHWDAVAGAEHYLLRVQDEPPGGGAPPPFIEEATTFAETTVVLGPYSPEHTVRMKVVAVVNGEASEESSVAAVTLPSGPPS